MLGCIEHNPDGTETEFGVGLALSSWSEGILAYMDQSGEEIEFSTYIYSVEAAESAAFEARPDYLNDEKNLQTDPEGHGNTWGQSYNEEDGMWYIWSYNDDSTEAQWETGKYHFYYTE